MAKKARKHSPRKKKSSRKKAPIKRHSPARRKQARRVPHVPAGYRSVTPYLAVRDAIAALAFYQRVFGADKLMEFKDGGRIAHAELKLGDAHIMLADENPAVGFHAPTAGSAPPVSILVYVEDVDAAVERAVKAGARIERPVADQFYGDRIGVFIDPFGHRWQVATHVEDVTDAELERRMAALQGI